MNQQIAQLVLFAVCFVSFFASSGLLLFVVVYHFTALAPHYNINKGGYRPYNFFFQQLQQFVSVAVSKTGKGGGGGGG